MAIITQTVADILYKGFRYAGILRGPMRGLSGSQQGEGVMILNSLLDMLKSDKSSVYAVNRAVFPMNAGQQNYSIGQDTAGALPDWNIERPEVIERAGYIWTNATPNIEVPFEILNEQEYDALSPKELQSTIATKLSYRPTTPNGTVFLWPIPTSSWLVALYLWQTVAQISGPDDILQMPNAYDDMLSYGLAVRLASLYPQFSNQISLQENKNHFTAARQTIRAINDPALLVQCESGSMGMSQRAAAYGGRYNPLTNSYN